jgi:hypothetical protein
LNGSDQQVRNVERCCNTGGVGLGVREGEDRRRGPQGPSGGYSRDAW